MKMPELERKGINNESINEQNENEEERKEKHPYIYSATYIPLQVCF